MIRKRPLLMSGVSSVDLIPEQDLNARARDFTLFIFSSNALLNFRYECGKQIGDIFSIVYKS